jgi:hypothetical protein
MRTTIRLDDQLLADAKAFAVQTGKTLSAVIADGLREILGRRAKNVECKPVKLPRMSGNGVRPGANIDSNAELLDLME